MINGNQKTVDQRKLMQAQKLISEAFGEDSPEALENSPDRFARWQTVALSDARKAYQPGKVKLYPIAPKSAVELTICGNLIRRRLRAQERRPGAGDGAG